MEVMIRRAVPRDVPQMLSLVRELAVFEREPDAVTVTENEMLEAGFGEKAVWVGWVAMGMASAQGVGNDEQVGEMLGMAVCYERYSTWKGRCLYLEDIVVTGSARGRGIGEKLFKACAAYAVEQGYHQMLWQVLDWNADAIRFYKRFGAEISSEWLNGRLYKEQMMTLLRSDGTHD